MKKSALYHLAQIAVVNSPSISAENKLEILKELFSKEDTELFFENKDEE